MVRATLQRPCEVSLHSHGCNLYRPHCASTDAAYDPSAHRLSSAVTLSRQAHSLLLQRKAELSVPASSASPPLSEHSAQCSALVRLLCGLCCCAGWQLEAADVTNVLLLASPLSSDEALHVDDGGELCRLLVCFVALCRPAVNKLTSAWSLALSTIRRACLAPGPLPTRSALTLLLELHLAFCRSRSTERLLPGVLARHLELPVEASHCSAALTLLLDFQDRQAFDELLVRGMGQATAPELPGYAVFVHWMLVNEAELSSAHRFAYAQWLSSAAALRGPLLRVHVVAAAVAPRLLRPRALAPSTASKAAGTAGHWTTDCWQRRSCAGRCGCRRPPACCPLWPRPPPPPSLRPMLGTCRPTSG